jgi:hypothetical protein
MQNNYLFCGKNVFKSWIFISITCVSLCVYFKKILNFIYFMCKNFFLDTLYTQNLYTHFHNLNSIFISIISKLYTSSTDIYNYYYKVNNYIIV